MRSIVSNLEQELQKFDRWMYEFDLGNGVKTQTYSESLQPIHAVRHSMIFSFLDSISFNYPDATLLDLACNEGYFTFEAMKRGAKSGLGIDARPLNIDKANFIKANIPALNCEFRVGDIYDYPYENKKYDVVFLLGILYHVENPIGLLRLAASLTSKFLFVETQLCQTRGAIPFGWGSSDLYLEGTEYCVLHQEQDIEGNPLASLGGFSFVPNIAAVVAMLRAAGFCSVVQLHPNSLVREPQYDKIDRAILVGIK
jgi:tRNA (mo5U34)-methyltransferase